MHLPITAFPHFGHGNVVSVFLTRRMPQEEHFFSWSLKIFDLGAEI